MTYTLSKSRLVDWQSGRQKKTKAKGRESQSVKQPSLGKVPMMMIRMVRMTRMVMMRRRRMKRMKRIARMARV